MVGTDTARSLSYVATSLVNAARNDRQPGLFVLFVCFSSEIAQYHSPSPNPNSAVTRIVALSASFSASALRIIQDIPSWHGQDGEFGSLELCYQLILPQLGPSSPRHPILPSQPISSDLIMSTDPSPRFLIHSQHKVQASKYLRCTLSHLSLPKRTTMYRDKAEKRVAMNRCPSHVSIIPYALAGTSNSLVELAS